MGFINQRSHHLGAPVAVADLNFHGMMRRNRDLGTEDTRPGKLTKKHRKTIGKWWINGI